MICGKLPEIICLDRKLINVTSWFWSLINIMDIINLKIPGCTMRVCTLNLEEYESSY